jgi:hypothetical protein
LFLLKCIDFSSYYIWLFWILVLHIAIIILYLDFLGRFTYVSVNFNFKLILLDLVLDILWDIC